MTRTLALLLSLAAACGDAPAPDASDEPTVTSKPVAKPSPALEPCGGTSALPGGVAQGEVAMPALTRSATTLAGLGTSVDLAAGAAVTLHHVAVPQTGGSAQACVTSGEVSGYVQREAVAVLPFQATLKSKNEGVKGKPVVVEGAKGDKVQVNLSGFFDPDPTIAPGSAEKLDMVPFAEPLLLGDLDLASWRPVKGGEGVLDAGVTLRGLAMPAGSLLRWSGNGQLTEVELRAGAEVGGRSLEAGTALVLSQGCDISLRAPGGEESCLSVEAGKLTAP